MALLVTGGAGFIGSAVLRRLAALGKHDIVNVDSLTYAGNLESLSGVVDHRRCTFERVDICDTPALREVFRRHQPDAVLHLAAETHVDRSIDSPERFVRTNVEGTAGLLEVALDHFRGLPAERARNFRLLHVSTDEVYGDASSHGPATEHAPYAPSSPYAATKASADHLVRAWHRTFGLPVMIAVSSNNYGPFQFPEKLIPHMVLSALGGRKLPVYGDGSQVRNWLHVEDHVDALLAILDRGAVGETYNVAGGAECANLDVVLNICALLEKLAPREPDRPRYASLVEHVTDRLGHDCQYSMDAGLVSRELGWRPKIPFEEGLAGTVRWYLDNRGWWQRVLERYSLRRLGMARAT